MAFQKGNKLKRFTGKKHTEESKKKCRDTINRLYDEGKLMGFRSEKGKEVQDVTPILNYWKGKKLPYPVWNKGKKGLQVGWNKGKKCPNISGEKSPLWKGGITPLRIKIQHTDNWKSWVKKILERDNYKCIFCGVTNNNLHVDHIIPYCIIRQRYNIKTVEDAINCETLWDIDNGRTLCKECHKKTDSYLSKAFKLLKEEENDGHDDQCEGSMCYCKNRRKRLGDKNG